jgi:hypothetical protein
VNRLIAREKRSLPNIPPGEKCTNILVEMAVREDQARNNMYYPCKERGEILMSENHSRKRRGRNQIDIKQEAEAKSDFGNAAAFNQADASIFRNKKKKKNPTE